MRKAEDSTALICVWQMMALTILMISLIWPSPKPASAGGLKDTVKDLYGGDGITLAPPPPGGFNHSPHFTGSSLGALGTLNSALTSNLGVLSFNSTATSFTFSVTTRVCCRS